MRDRAGKEITVKEFFQRWKQGIQAVTPLQQTFISLIGNILVLIGVIVGLITTFLLGVWWLFIVLLGSLFLSSMGLLANLQKYIAFKDLQRRMKNVEESTS